MTPPDATKDPCETVLVRNEHRTHINERRWLSSRMISTSITYSDGLHHCSFLTYSDHDYRQSSMSVHRSALIEVNDRHGALELQFRAPDGTPLSFTAYGVTLEDLELAIAKARAVEIEKVSA